MAVSQKISDSRWDRIALGRILPKREWLVGEYLLGVSEAETVKNRANPDLPMTVQGSPTFNAHSVTVRSHASTGYGFRTGIVPDEGRTLIVVRKNAAIATTVTIVGMSGAVQVWGMGQFGADNYMSNGENATNQGAKRTRPASASDIYFEAAVHYPQSYGRGYYGSGGVLTEVISTDLTVGKRMTTSNVANYFEIVIGTTGLTDSVNNNTEEIYFAAIYNAPLTADELDDAYQRIRTLFATAPYGSLTVV